MVTNLWKIIKEYREQTGQFPGNEYWSNKIMNAYYADCESGQIEPQVSLGDSRPMPEPNQQNGGWISVKDRLPVDDKQYLVYTIFLDMKVRHFNFDKMVWDDEYGDDYYCDAIGGKVTHWQPLPQLPLK